MVLRPEAAVSAAASPQKGRGYPDFFKREAPMGVVGRAAYTYTASEIFNLFDLDLFVLLLAIQEVQTLRQFTQIGHSRAVRAQGYSAL